MEKIKDLPPCPLRLGRVWDNEQGAARAVPTCGGIRQVNLVLCLQCGGFDGAMVKYVEPKSLIVTFKYRQGIKK